MPVKIGSTSHHSSTECELPHGLVPVPIAGTPAINAGLVWFEAVSEIEGSNPNARQVASAIWTISESGKTGDVALRNDFPLHRHAVARGFFVDDSCDFAVEAVE